MNFLFKIVMLSACAMLYSALLPGVASAAINVYPISVTTNSQGAAQIKVMSASANMNFVKVTVKAIDNPGTKEEKERDLVAGENLVVSPAKFGLSAGSVRIVRMVNMEPPQVEKAYRVIFESVNNLDEGTPVAEDVKGSIAVNFIWGALVIVPPSQPKESISYISDSHELNNNGNVHITLKEVGICKSREESDNCKWAKNLSTIYPGQKLMLKTSDTPISSGNIVKIKYLSGISQTTIEQAL